MTALDLSQRPASPTPGLPTWLWHVVVGFGHWLMFLLVLEPGNLLRAAGDGHPLRLGDEVPRILVAAAMGAAVTPLLMALIGRFPIEGQGRWRHLAIMAGAVAAIALGLLVVSCFPAAWWFQGRALPTARTIGDTVADNWPLLIYCMATFVAIVHAVRAHRRSHPGGPFDRNRAPRIVTSNRGRVELFDPAEVDWIEAQGNYVALHIGQATHLVRDTLAGFEKGLEQGRFVRIHRRAIVAIDRIGALKPLANGDATLILRDGRALRLSRNYRRAVAARLVEEPGSQ